jgi:hypothetical protein
MKIGVSARGSTPAAFRHTLVPLASYTVQQRLGVALKRLVFRDLIHSIDVQGSLVASRDSRTNLGGYPAEHKRTVKAKQRVLFRDVADEWLALQLKPNANGKVAITRKSAKKQMRIVTRTCTRCWGTV